VIAWLMMRHDDVEAGSVPFKKLTAQNKNAGLASGVLGKELRNNNLNN
jgi:hypothetical protein